MRVNLHQTIEFMETAACALEREDLLEWPYIFDHRSPWQRLQGLTLESARDFVLQLEGMAAKLNRDDGYESPKADTPDPRFPTYGKVLEVVPIYKDAISLECRQPLVKPTEIPRLLYLLRIPGHAEGLDIEEHGFGYHFHYGRIKGGSISRTNLLLTFKPSDAPKKKTSQSKLPLYYEYHADGKNKPIDAEAIGLNKRRPIYLVCHDLGLKRGFQNFKCPSSDSRVFFGD